MAPLLFPPSCLFSLKSNCYFASLLATNQSNIGPKPQRGGGASKAAGQVYGVRDQADLEAIACAEEQSMKSAEVLLRHQDEQYGQDGAEALGGFQTSHKHASDNEHLAVPGVAIAQTTRSLFHGLLADVSGCRGTRHATSSAAADHRNRNMRDESNPGGTLSRSNDQQDKEVDAHDKHTNETLSHEQLLDMMTALALCHTVVAHQYHSEETNMASTGNIPLHVQGSGIQNAHFLGLDDGGGEVPAGDIDKDKNFVLDLRPSMRRHSISLNRRILSVRALSHTLLNDGLGDESDDEPEGYYSEPIVVEQEDGLPIPDDTEIEVVPGTESKMKVPSGRSHRHGSVSFAPYSDSCVVDGDSVVRVTLNDVTQDDGELRGETIERWRSKSTLSGKGVRGLLSGGQALSWRGSTRKNPSKSESYRRRSSSLSGRWSQHDAPTRVHRVGSMHDYMFMDSNNTDVAVEYNAESPDELGLVKAANELGFCFQGVQGGGAKQVAVLYSSHPTCEAMVSAGGEQDGLGSSCGSIASVSARGTHPLSTNKGLQERMSNHCASPRVPGRMYRSEWERVAVNEFSSKRKCMSVMYRVPNKKNEYLVLVKGADERVLPKCQFPGTFFQALKHEAVGQLNHYACLGLRTLVIGQKRISAKEAKIWLEKLEMAKTKSTKDEGNNAHGGSKTDQIEALANELECGLSLLGITAVEDRLQKGVPETIAKLRQAEIPLWVLTGDKVETAINIAFSSNLIDEKTMIAKVVGSSCGPLDVEGTASVDSKNGGEVGTTTTHSLCVQLEKVRKELEMVLPSLSPRVMKRRVSSSSSPVESNLSPRPTVILGCSGGDDDPPARCSSRSTDLSVPVESGPHESIALIVDGKALELLLEEEHGTSESQTTLLAVARECNVLIACRVSPSQKALLVRMVKEGVRPEPVTLAIGDGGNDVAMVQTADIGVGISGNEGNQAVNASDFSIAEFRFLKPLLLAHGRRNYMTMAKVVALVIYANLLFTFGTFFFNFESGFSGQPVFNELWYTFWNAFVAVPTILIGFFDRDMSPRKMANRPELYQIGPQNLMLNRRVMVYLVLSPFAHAFVVYMFAVNFNNGVMAPLVVVGSTLYLSLVAVISTRTVFTASVFTWPLTLAILFNLTFSFAAVVIYNRMTKGNTVALEHVGARLVWLPVPLTMFLVVVADRLLGGIGVSVRGQIMRQGTLRRMHGHNSQAMMLVVCVVPVVVLACILWAKDHASFLTTVTA